MLDGRKKVKSQNIFCNFESRNYINKVVKRVDIEKHSVSNQFEILNQVKTFYENLYLNRDSEH